MQDGQVVRVLSGCATCGVVSCDRTRPTCMNCTLGKQKTLKLFWPRAVDGRRAVVSTSQRPELAPVTDQTSDAHFVNTSYWDIELFNSLTNPATPHSLWLMDVQEFWNPTEVDTCEEDLLEYFRTTASTALTTFGYDATALGDVLIRIALEGQRASRKAALQALLAFSSLHRDGLQMHSVELKIASIGNLASGSTEGNLCGRQTMEHIAAGMLLCSFEAHQSSCTYGQWTGYLAGVKTMLKATSAKALLQMGSDAAVLLDWVYYHDVLARFSMLGWKGIIPPELKSTKPDHFCPEISNLSPPVSSMLDLLAQICEAEASREGMLVKNDNIEDYKSFLRVMDFRIRRLPIPKATDDNNDSTLDEILSMELYQLCMMIYLDRSSQGLINQPTRTQQHIDRAFELLPRLGSCRQQFPVHIIGCEAKTDEQRTTVLDLISRTDKTRTSRSFYYSRKILQAVWAQDDLAHGKNLAYREKLTLVLTHCLTIPSFV